MGNYTLARRKLEEKIQKALARPDFTLKARARLMLEKTELVPLLRS